MSTQTIEIPYDSIITLLVFLIGVPTLVLQSMPPDVRHILFERRRLLGYLLGLILIPALSAVLVSGVGIYAEINMSHDVKEQAIRWVVVLSVMIFVILIVAIYFPLRYSRRQGVLRLLEWEALQYMKSKGRLPEEAIEDIIDLGKNAESPQEKGVVLQSIHTLVTKTCVHPLYAGDSLETLILRIHEIVIVDSKPVNLENFRIVAEIFQAIAIARREIQHVADLQRTVKATGSMGRATLMKFEFGLEVDNIIMSFIQTLGLITYIKPLDVINKQHFNVMTDISEALFDIGSLAAEKQRDFIAVAALDKMITLLCQTPVTEDLPPHVVDELSADVVGLMAHVWTEGDGQKEFILKRMPDVKVCLALPYPKIFKKARIHYLEKSQFETANRLAQMAEDLKPRQRPRKKN
jgi:hypothetical protein